MLQKLSALIIAAAIVVSPTVTVAGPVAAIGPVSSPSSAVDAARAKVAGGDTAGAITDLQSYVPAHPGDLAAARLLGDLYYRIPDDKRAESTWKAIIVRVPGDRETHNRLGSLYASQDRVADAIAEYEKSLPTHGGFAGLVAAHRKQGDLNELISRFATDADEHVLDAGAQSYYANLLRALHRYADAQPYFKRVVVLSASSCGALVDSGNNLIDLGQFDEAIATLESCIRMQPNYYPALIDVGDAYLEKKHDERGRAYFEHALAVNPSGSEALVNLGYLEDLAGRWKSAVGYYLRAMYADPLQSAAYIDLGFDYNEHQFYTLAEAAFLKGLSVAPDDGRLHYMLGVTYNVQSKIELARDQYDLAVASQDTLVVRAARAELALLPR